MKIKKTIAVLMCCLVFTSAYALTWIQGSYTGDGLNNHAITGLGFQPDVVIIKGSAATPAFMRTANQAAGESKQMDAAGAFSTTAIKSFTSTGFTLGTNANVNTAGATYYFVAFDAGTDLVLGTYPGNAAISKSITGLGFSPDLVIIFSDNALGTSSPSFLNSAMPDDKANRFGNAGLWGFSISSLDANGFTVGSNNNASGETYYYAAFRAASSTEMKSGSYTGSASNKTITITGMTPRFILAVNESAVATSAMMKMAAMPAASSVGFNSAAVSNNDITALSAGSFTVKGGSTNTNNTTYTNYYTAFGGGGQLPVELQDFKAVCKEGKAVISWVTASETNNDYFTVERSRDGKTFEEVGRVAGAGTSKELRSYSFTDEQTFTDVIYYRLKQTDYDGNYEYFQLTAFENCQLISGLDVNLYPNPGNGEMSCAFELNQNTQLAIEVRDLLGKIVYQEKVQAEKGNQSLRLDLFHLPKGLYFFTMHDGVNVISEKIVKE